MNHGESEDRSIGLSPMLVTGHGGPWCSRSPQVKQVCQP